MPQCPSVLLVTSPCCVVLSATDVMCCSVCISPHDSLGFVDSA